MEFEASIIKFLQSNATTGWISLFQIITVFGSFFGIFITFLILFYKKRSLSYAFVVTFVVASILNKILKYIILRDRPFVTYDFIINYGNEDGYSMPSGHSMIAGLISTYLFYLTLKCSSKTSTKILASIVLIIYPMLIAFSRMILGVHYITDTIVGIILGITFAIIGIIVYNISIKKSYLMEKK